MIEWGAGLAGGCAGVAVGHPFDTVKVKLQTQDFRNPRYKGTWDCFAQTVRKDGVRGLYRGMASPMAGVGVVNAIIFGVHGNVSRQFKNPDALSTHFIAGTCAGVTQSFICCPVELTKTRLQIQADMVSTTASGGSPAVARYAGPIDCLRETWRVEGVRGVFKGQTITICREIPAFGMYFLSYEWLSRKMKAESMSGAAGAAAVLTAGGLAGTASWLVSYPIDVVKSRLQSDGAFGPARYKGIMDCAVTSVREEGWGVMSRGLNSTLLRAFPTNAATFFVVTSVMKHFHHQGEDDSAVSGSTCSKLKEIYHTGEVIISEAAAIAQEMRDYQKDALNKLKENHLNNYLPAVLATAEESILNIERYRDGLAKTQLSPLDPDTRQALDAIISVPIQKACLKKVQMSQAEKDFQAELLNQRILSLVL